MKHHRVYPSFAAALALLALSAGPALADKYPVAVFSGLDKITARVVSFEARVDEPVQFGSLEVLVRNCDKKPPEETPRTATYVEIRQLERDEDKPEDEAVAPQEGDVADANAPIFKGWMFAENPGLNALEHPVYDIWLTDCKTSSGAASRASE
jgi:hypothetical protein